MVVCCNCGTLFLREHATLLWIENPKDEIGVIGVGLNKTWGWTPGSNWALACPKCQETGIAGKASFHFMRKWKKEVLELRLHNAPPCLWQGDRISAAILDKMAELGFPTRNSSGVEEVEEEKPEVSELLKRVGFKVPRKESKALSLSTAIERAKKGSMDSLSMLIRKFPPNGKGAVTWAKSVNPNLRALGKKLDRERTIYEELAKRLEEASEPVKPLMEEWLSGLGFSIPVNIRADVTALMRKRVGLVLINEYQSYPTWKTTSRWTFNRKSVIRKKGRIMAKLTAAEVMQWYDNHETLWTERFTDDRGKNIRGLEETDVPWAIQGTVNNCPDEFLDRASHEDPEDNEAMIDFGVFYEKTEEWVKDREDNEELINIIDSVE